MIRTQIQLPNQLHRELKAFAAAREATLAETVRRAVEYLMEVHPQPQPPRAPWSFPEVRDMGRVLLPENEWTLAANETTETALRSPRRKRS